MGNAAQKAGNRDVDEPPVPIPELIRQSSKSKEEECSICLELQRKGILCATEEHFICEDCFAPYVTSIVEVFLVVVVEIQFVLYYGLLHPLDNPISFILC